MINLIGISGYMNSGKSTVGAIIQGLTSPNSNMPEWEIKGFSVKLKEIASILTGIPAYKFEDQEFKKSNMSKEWWNTFCNSGKEAMTYRTFLQLLGTDSIRDNIHPNTWVNALFADYRCKDVKIVDIYNTNQDYIDNTTTVEIEANCPKWVITDCRFVNEAQEIKKRGGIIVRVKRDRWESHTDNQGITTTIKIGPIDLHSSETALDSWNFDYVIDNNGTIEELVEKTREMLKKYEII